MLGGSSSINGMVYIRGHAGDYDGWERAGASGWSYAHVLPYFKRAERHLLGADAYHGAAGPLTVFAPDLRRTPLAAAFVAAAVQANYGAAADPNGERQEGFGRVDRTTTADGRRCSTARAYLTPALRRANLRIVTGALVRRVVLEDGRAVGVEYSLGGALHTARAESEVIVSAGAFNTPQLLQLSGIGPGQELAARGVRALHDLPAVGANLSVMIRSADPATPPAIRFNYLAAPQDRADLRAAVRLTREIIAQPALSPYRGPELNPGPAVQSDADIDAWVRRAVETCYHPVGTCRMGRGAADSVVDAECRVHGLEGSRVIDASIMPAIVSGNTNAPTIMIAEKMSDVLRGKPAMPREAAPVWRHPAWATSQR